MTKTSSAVDIGNVPSEVRHTGIIDWVRQIAELTQPPTSSGLTAARKNTTVCVKRWLPAVR